MHSHNKYIVVLLLCHPAALSSDLIHNINQLWCFNFHSILALALLSTSSEIEKNQVKSELMKSKISKMSVEKKLIELKKLKLSLEIQNLQTPFQPALFATELWLPVTLWCTANAISRTGRLRISSGYFYSYIVHRKQAFKCSGKVLQLCPFMQSLLHRKLHLTVERLWAVVQALCKCHSLEAGRK